MSVKVLNIRSLAYSGTTWITLVLASHERALALGAGDRIFELRPDDAARACMVHAAACPFWPTFIRDYDRNGRFLEQLAEYSGRNVFVINNPSVAVTRRHFEVPGVDLLTVKQVRDGRANMHSWMRHHPEHYAEFYDAVRAWMWHAWVRLRDLDAQAPRPFPLLRYEDMIADWQREANAVGAQLGIEYDAQAVRYWQWGHHLPTGNTGVLDLLQRLGGGSGLEHRRREHYDRVLEAAIAEPDRPVLDESWRQALSPIDLAAYDFVVGELHAGFGYARDAIASADMAEFRRRYGVPNTAAEAVAQIPKFDRRNPPPPRAAVRRGLLQRLRAWASGRVRHG